jgi:hypothetical protein
MCQPRFLCFDYHLWDAYGLTQDKLIWKVAATG